MIWIRQLVFAFCFIFRRGRYGNESCEPFPLFPRHLTIMPVGVIVVLSVINWGYLFGGGIVEKVYGSFSRKETTISHFFFARIFVTFHPPILL